MTNAIIITTIITITINNVVQIEKEARRKVYLVALSTIITWVNLMPRKNEKWRPKINIDAKTKLKCKVKAIELQIPLMDWLANAIKKELERVN